MEGMTRQACLYAQGTLHHVIVRGDRKTHDCRWWKRSRGIYTI